MKCSSRLLCGLLMSCVCFRGSHEELSVIQSPSAISVNEGESAQISCCWNTTETYKVVWLKNGARLPAEKQLYTNCSVLHITNIVKKDTGDYVCRVTKDIPYLIESEGIKTALNVSDRKHSTETTTRGSTSASIQTNNFNKTDDRQNSPILHLSLAAAIGLVTLCLAFSLCKMRNSCKKTVERAVESREGADEDLEAGETQRNETEVPEREKGKDNTEEPEVTAAATEGKNEEKETVVVVDFSGHC